MTGQKKNKTGRKPKGEKQPVVRLGKKETGIEELLDFQARYETFVNFPRKFESAFIGQMASSGLYCSNKKTKCIYCDFKKENWDTNDDPAAVHSRSKCIVFELHKKRNREKYNGIHGFKCDCNGLCVEMSKNEKYIFCGVCGKCSYRNKEGGIDFRHECCGCSTMKRFGQKSKNNFYSDYFSGKYSTLVSKHLEMGEYEIPEEKAELIGHILENTGGKLLDLASTQFEQGMKEVATDLDNEMKEEEIKLNISQA